MALELSSIVFKASTDELDAAVKKIETLGKSVEGLASSLGKLDKESAAANKTQAQANLLTAKAATETAKAATETAKASAITTKSQDQNTAATERLTKATKERQSVEERQSAITRLMAEGNSRGQASILATAEALGEATDKTNEYLKAQRAMSSNNPFDRSLGAATVFANELKVATVASDLYNKDLGFTKNQLQELGREHVRLTEQFKVQGKSLSGLDTEFNKIVQSAQKVTQAENAMATSMKNADKATIDAGRANAYIENELQKVRFALQANNDELNRSTANSLVKFENNLKRSGLTLDQQKLKIDEYRRAQIELQKTQSANKTDYITRAVGPQITDIVVGLSTGQSPLTVMMQQGGQLRDQFGMMGIAAEDMGDVMRNAMTGMTRSVLDTGKAIGTMLVGGFMDASKAVLNYVTDLTGFNNILEKTKYQLTLARNEGDAFAGALLKGLTFIGSFLTGVLAVGLVATIGSFIALGIAMKQVITQESELSKAMALSGASLGLTQQGAIDLADAYAGAKGNIGAYTAAITESAKAGNITKDNLYMVTSAAIELEKVTGIKVAETIKSFSKLAEDPAKEFAKLAKDIGTINPEVVALVNSLQDQGEKAQAATIATAAYSAAIKNAALDIRSDMGYLESFFSGIGKAAGTMWDAILNVGRKGSITKQLEDATSKLDERIKSGAAFYETKGDYNFAIDNLKEIVRLAQEQVNKEKELGDQKKANSKQIGADAFNKKVEDELGKKELSQSKKQITQQEYINKQLEEYKKQTDYATLSTENLAKATAVFGEEWKRAQPKAEKAKITQEQKDIIRGLEEQVDIENKSLGINKEYNNQMYRARLLFEKNLITQEKLQETMLMLEQQQPGYIAGLAAQKKLTEDMKKDNESILKLKEDSAKFLSDENFKTQKTTSDYNLRLSLLGKTEEQQKKITQEAELQSKLAESNNEFEKQRTKLLDDYEKAKRTANLETNLPQLEKDKNDALIALDIARADNQRVINQETAVKAAEGMQKEFDAIKSSITDVITTALFDGGKAGSKKLRDQVVAAFRNKITVVIDAAVNTLMGSATSSLLGGNKEGGIGSLSNVASLASLASSIGTVGSQVVTGAMSLTNAIGTIGANATGTGISGLLASNAAFGTAAPTAMSTITGAIGAIPGWGWALMAGVAVAAMLEGGETRSGASYTSANGKAVFEKGPSGGEIAGKESKILMENAMSAITGTLKAVGSKATLTGFVAGLESSDNGKGFNYAGGKINGKGFGESLGRDGGQFAMVSQDAKTAFANYGKELSQSILEALQITEDIPEALSSMLDGVDIAGLTTEETDALLATINTLVQSVTGFNTAMLSLPFDYLKDMSFDTAAGLIAAAGGLATLTTNLSGFYDNFYTDAEKVTNLTKNTSAAFAELGITMPAINESTREWYRSEVERLGAMDLSVEANATAYASILGLQSAVNSLAPTFEEAAQAATAAAESLLNSMESNVDSALNVLEKAVDTQKSILQAQSDILDTGITTSEALITALSSVFTYLSEEVKGLYLSVTSTSAMLVSTARGVISSAVATGSINDIDELKSAIAVVKDSLDAVNFQSKVDQDRARLLLAGDLKNLQDATEYQLTTEEKILKILKDQKSVLEAQLDDLESTLALANEQVDIAKNGVTATLSVADAVNEVNSSVWSLINAQSLQASEARLASIKDYIVSVYNTASPETEKQSLIKIANTAKEYGVSLADAAKSMNLSADSVLALYKRFGVEWKSSLGTLGSTAIGATQTTTTTSPNTGAPTLSFGPGSSVTTGGGQPSVTRGRGVTNAGSAYYVQANSLYDSGSSYASLGQTYITDPAAVARLDSIAASVAINGVATPAAITQLASTAKQYGVSMQDLATASGYKIADVQALFASQGIPAFEGGGSYGGGLALVGEKGPELINFSNPGQVYTAPQTRNMLSSSDSESRVESLLSELNDNISGLRYEVRADVSHNSQVQKLLNRVSPDGRSLSVSFLEPQDVNIV